MQKMRQKMSKSDCAKRYSINNKSKVTLSACITEHKYSNRKIAKSFKSSIITMDKCYTTARYIAVQRCIQYCWICADLSVITKSFNHPSKYLQALATAGEIRHCILTKRHRGRLSPLNCCGF